MSGGREWAEPYLSPLNLRVSTAVKDNYIYYFFWHDVSSRRLKEICYCPKWESYQELETTITK